MKCPLCGKETPIGKYCEECGSDISKYHQPEKTFWGGEHDADNDGSNNKQNANTDDSHKRTRIAIIASVLIVFALVIICLITYGNPQNDIDSYEPTSAYKYNYSFDEKTTDINDYNSDYSDLDSNLYSYEDTTEPANEKPTDKPTEPKIDNTPLEHKNALVSAESYLKHSSFSKEELREQLKYEQFSDASIQYALDNNSADWKQEALESAESYLKHSSFSKDSLYEQLIHEKYTEDQALYGINNVSANWNEEAVEAAKSYLSHSSFSKSDLYDQLIFEKFTPEQAQYGVDIAYQ